MKYVTVFLLLFTQVSFAEKANKEVDVEEYHTCFFPKSSVNLGVSYLHSLTVNEPGATIKVNFNLTERLGLGTEFSTSNFESDKLDVGVNSSFIFDVVGIGVSPVVGADYHITPQKIVFVSGFGIHKNFKRLTLFTDYSHHFLAKAEDFMSIGLLFHIYNFEKQATNKETQL